ncbi:MAG: hypothetical protein HYU69_07305 [Bacteroidetes bacterium]|nr:hypothetical protein [Bacteroidota bacterium]
MKKSILMLAFSTLVVATFAFNGPQEGAAKKSCSGKAEKSCCKKGAQSAKSCDKKQDDKAEVKATETKTVEAAAETKK